MRTNVKREHGTILRIQAACQHVYHLTVSLDGNPQICRGKKSSRAEIPRLIPSTCDFERISSLKTLVDMILLCVQQSKNACVGMETVPETMSTRRIQK